MGIDAINARLEEGQRLAARSEFEITIAPPTGPKLEIRGLRQAGNLSVAAQRTVSLVELITQPELLQQKIGEIERELSDHKFRGA